MQREMMRHMPPEEAEHMMRMMRKGGDRDPRMMEMMMEMGGMDMMREDDMMDEYGPEFEQMDPEEREMYMMHMERDGGPNKGKNRMRMMQMGMMGMDPRGRFGRFGYGREPMKPPSPKRPEYPPEKDAPELKKHTNEEIMAL